MHTLRLISLPLALILFGGCAGVPAYSDPPRVSLTDLKPLGMTLFEQRYLLRLRIQNPNPAELPIRGMNYEVYLNGEKFAYGVSSQAVTVPAFGEKVVEVEVISTLLDIVEQIRGWKPGQQKLTWRISGGLKIENLPGSVPFDYEGQLDLSPR